MTKSIEMLLLSVIYSVFLNIAFFSKKHVKTPELLAFKRLIVINFFGLIFELGCFFTILSFGPENMWSMFFCRAYLIYLTVFNVLFFDYQYTISRGTDYYLKHSSRIRRRVLIIIAIICIFAIFFPLTAIKSDTGIYSEGLAANMMYLISFGASGLMWLFMFKGLKEKTCKFSSCIPFIALEVLSIVVIVIQLHNHQFTLFTVMETLILLIMYFTIENSDVRLIEELKISKNEAEKASNAKTDFIASMSHEIRNPLNAIVGFAEDIRIRSAESSKAINEDANYIVDASNTLLEIVGNILDVNKLESNELELKEKPYNLKEVINECIKQSTPKIGDKNLKLTVDISEAIPILVVGDQVYVKEIFNNLLTNAVKYTDQGEIGVKVTCDIDEDITIHFVVSDTGQGFKEESKARLFTKFDRLDATINSNIEGIGLGLAITKMLVQMMNGTIKLESEYQKGSTFFVDIKQKQASEDELEKEMLKNKEEPVRDMVVKEAYLKESKEQELGEDAKKILVVDDNLLNVKVSERTLKMMGYKVIGAASGKEAIDKVKTEKYDLILMDIMMPEMDGVECLKTLKGIPEFKVPVVAFTADAIAGAEEKYLSDGFNGYLSKPFNKVDAEKIFKKILG